MILSLDLSSVSTGYALFQNNKLINHGQIQPDKKLDIDFRLHYVVKELQKMFDKSDNLVIEDTWLGTNVDALKDLSKIAGAVIFAWIDKDKKIKPIFIQPNVARPAVGLKANASKAEIQIWIIEKYNLADKKKIAYYKKQIQLTLHSTEKEEFNLNLKKKSFKFGSAPFKKTITMIKQLKNKRKYALDKLSKEIEKELKLGNDEADAIVTGLAYILKNIKG